MHPFPPPPVLTNGWVQGTGADMHPFPLRPSQSSGGSQLHGSHIHAFPHNQGQILAGPSGADRICMPSPTKKVKLMCTGLVNTTTKKMGLNKLQPLGMASTARQRVQTLLTRAPRTQKMSCTHNMTCDLNTRAGDGRQDKQLRTQRVRKRQTANHGGRR